MKIYCRLTNEVIEGDLIHIFPANEVPKLEDVIKYYCNGDASEIFTNKYFKSFIKVMEFNRYVLRKNNGHSLIFLMNPKIMEVVSQTYTESIYLRDDQTCDKRPKYDLREVELEVISKAQRAVRNNKENFEIAVGKETMNYLRKLLDDRNSELRIQRLKESEYPVECVEYAKQDSKVTAELYETVHKNEVEEIVANYLKENLKIELKKHGVSEKWLEVFLKIGGVVKGSGVRL